MSYKKLFMPILSDGDDVKNRIYGAILVARYFNVHLEILHSIAGVKTNRELPKHILNDLNEFAKNKQQEESTKFIEVLKELSAKTNVPLTKHQFDDTLSIHALIQLGERNSMIAEESKYADAIVMASPLDGEINQSFETAITQSGKPAIIISRQMKEFKTDSILIAWNNSSESSRVLSNSLEILKKAKKVELVSSSEYLKDTNGLERITAYLKMHNIDVQTELLKTTLHPGEALLKKAHNDKFDMIIIGANAHDGLKEIMFGGVNKYLLKNSKIPLFMSC
jgi:nucleotide-binding universal stress UspA family protein